MLPEASLRPSALVAALVTVLAVATPAFAQVLEQPTTNASAWFGLRGDGVRVGQGQSFRLPVSATIWYAEFLFENSGHVDSGVAPGQQTDEIQCTLRRVERLEPLGSAVAPGFANPSPGTRLRQSTCFPLGLFVPAGDYVITCENLAPTHYGFLGNASDESYPEGKRYVGFDGTWAPFVWDATFRIRYSEPGTSIGPGPSVTLVATPHTGRDPLEVVLSAQVVLGEREPATYTFWTHCEEPSADLAIVQSRCGAPVARLTVVGATAAVAHTYPTAGHFVPKVVVQAGCQPPSEMRSSISVGGKRRRAVRSR
jgi:hypothetical protein